MVYSNDNTDSIQKGIRGSMTTARERYEAKTKVVTFRVHQEVFDQLEQVKTRTGLSFGDLVKLGAGIAQEEIKAKLAVVSGLEDRLAELSGSVKQEQQGLSEFLDEEQRRRLEELDTEVKAFRLFDRRWTVEEASCKLSIPQATAYHHFEEWAKERKDKRAIQRELLRKCLKKHIDRLKGQRLWVALQPGCPEEDKG
jgi:hypothetical protein